MRSWSVTVLLLLSACHDFDALVSVTSADGSDDAGDDATDSGVGCAILPSNLPEEADECATGPPLRVDANNVLIDTDTGELFDCSAVFDPTTCELADESSQLAFELLEQQDDFVEEIAFVFVESLTVSRDVTLYVRGRAPLAIVSMGAARIEGTIDVSADTAQENAPGPGGLPGDGSTTFMAYFDGDSAPGSEYGLGARGKDTTPYRMGGGGGGANGGNGGDGGTIAGPVDDPYGDGDGGAGGTAREGTLKTKVLIGGAGGGSGGESLDEAHVGTRPPGGHGGGAIQISSHHSIVIRSTGRILANGGGGIGGRSRTDTSGERRGGGGGGGAGGTILLEAPTIEVAGDVVAHGGGGGGGDSNVASATGGDPGTKDTARAKGGLPSGGQSTAGGTGGSEEPDGADAADAEVTADVNNNVEGQGCGGGGGGGSGRIVLRVPEVDQDLMEDGAFLSPSTLVERLRLTLR